MLYFYNSLNKQNFDLFDKQSYICFSSYNQQQFNEISDKSNLIVPKGDEFIGNDVLRGRGVGPIERVLGVCDHDASRLLQFLQQHSHLIKRIIRCT